VKGHSVRGGAAKGGDVRTWRNRRQRADGEPARVGGFTLVELLVVIAILALMASVAVPTFARMGFFSRNEMQSTARELYALLRAAKIYAATYRVDTAVVYQDPEAADQVESAACLRAMSMMYEDVDADEDRPGYVRVQDVEGGFDFLDGLSAVVVQASLSHEERANATLPERGLSKVEVYFPNADVESFWAHVFTPSGRMRNSSRERFEIYVGFEDGMEEVEQWADPEDHSLGERYKTIELHRATGRVRIAADEG